MTDLTEEQMDAIAEKAARKALQIVYAEVGQSVLKKLTWLLGVATVAGLMFLAGRQVK